MCCPWHRTWELLYTHTLCACHRLLLSLMKEAGRGQSARFSPKRTFRYPNHGVLLKVLSPLLHKDIIPAQTCSHRKHQGHPSYQPSLGCLLYPPPCPQSAFLNPWRWPNTAQIQLLGDLQAASLAHKSTTLLEKPQCCVTFLLEQPAQLRLIMRCRTPRGT